VQHERPVAARAQVFGDCSENLFAAEDRRPFAREGVVGFNLQRQRRARLESGGFAFDHRA
jgi:hypothetical protein